MTTFLNFHAFAAARGEGLHPELRLLFERAQRLPFPTSPLGTTDSCSQGRTLLLKLSRSA
jgi:hypothetical protein